MKIKKCNYCGKDFMPSYHTVKYCSDECRKTALQGQKRKGGLKHYYSHREERLRKSKKYYRDHEDELKAYAKEYHKTHYVKKPKCDLDCENCIFDDCIRD